MAITLPVCLLSSLSLCSTSCLFHIVYSIWFEYGLHPKPCPLQCIYKYYVITCRPQWRWYKVTPYCPHSFWAVWVVSVPSWCFSFLLYYAVDIQVFGLWSIVAPESCFWDQHFGNFAVLIFCVSRFLLHHVWQQLVKIARISNATERLFFTSESNLPPHVWIPLLDVTACCQWHKTRFITACSSYAS